jgi:hypothetical protein
MVQGRRRATTRFWQRLVRIFGEARLRQADRELKRHLHLISGPDREAIIRCLHDREIRRSQRGSEADPEVERFGAEIWRRQLSDFNSEERTLP